MPRARRHTGIILPLRHLDITRPCMDATSCPAAPHARDNSPPPSATIVVYCYQLTYAPSLSHPPRTFRHELSACPLTFTTHSDVPPPFPIAPPTRPPSHPRSRRRPCPSGHCMSARAHDHLPVGLHGLVLARADFEHEKHALGATPRAPDSPPPCRARAPPLPRLARGVASPPPPDAQSRRGRA